ncbi:hypothetical protein Poly51_35690 [Rubripirellula tenax]|uniref:Uncharacterized protein n=1 Tax=Rubripirellula tenax TaxID=2528015 RepID=A0A5C6F2Y3_9BACT|nr:hypothetical protein [Rubripirellula tenax]TWU54850.1 hypothetical protein Poly51_35690 [Rubripirellula tenax]
MSISAGGYNFEVAALSPKATRGTQTTDTVSYVANSGGGGVDPAAAAAALLQHFRTTQPETIPFLRIDAEHINEKYALVTANLNETKLDPVSFNTTGATTHVNQSLGTRGIYAAPGKTAPNYRGAIGVSDSGVSGVDITVPAFEFSVRKKFEFVSTSYLLAVVAMTGRTNSTDWSIFGPGEALFLGGEGGEDDNNWVDITYHFAARPNQAALQLGEIGTVNKRGWDYLWVKHDEEVVGDRVLQTPAAAYVEQVYPEGNFNALGIS